MERTQFLEMQLPKYGFGYYLLTESDIRKSPRLNNIKFLLRNAIRFVELKEYEVIRREMELCRHFNWQEIIQEKDSTICLSKICRLIIDGYLYITVDDIWDSKTVVSLNSGYQINRGY